MFEKKPPKEWLRTKIVCTSNSPMLAPLQQHVCPLLSLAPAL